MDDLRISDMMEMQRTLWTLHKDAWPPIEPAYGKDFILYMMEEVGECIAILKKRAATPWSTTRRCGRTSWRRRRTC